MKQNYDLTDLQSTDSRVSIDLNYKVISGVLTITDAEVFHQDENGENWIPASDRFDDLFDEYAYKLLIEQLKYSEIYYDSVAG